MRSKQWHLKEKTLEIIRKTMPIDRQMVVMFSFSEKILKLTKKWAGINGRHEDNTGNENIGYNTPNHRTEKLNEEKIQRRTQE